MMSPQPSSLREIPLSSIAESGLVGLVLWDAQGRIHDANDRFLEMLGYDRAALDARTIDWTSITPTLSIGASV